MNGSVEQTTSEWALSIVHCVFFWIEDQTGNYASVVVESMANLINGIPMLLLKVYTHAQGPTKIIVQVVTKKGAMSNII